MKKYQGNATYTFDVYTIHSAADHLQAYREEYPTRRRQLNAANKDIENMRDAIEGIQARLNDGRTFTHYMGDQYNAHDLNDMRQDLANLEEARDIISATPCPAKVAKEMDKAREEAAKAEAAAAANEARKITIELPEGFTAYDFKTLIQLGTKEAHRQRMEAARNDFDIKKEAAQWAANLDKCNYLSDLYNGGYDIGDKVHAIAWEKEETLQEHREKILFNIDKY